MTTDLIMTTIQPYLSNGDRKRLMLVEVGIIFERKLNSHLQLWASEHMPKTRTYEKIKKNKLII